MIPRVLIYVACAVTVLVVGVAGVLLADWPGPFGREHPVVAPMDRLVRGAARASADAFSMPLRLDDGCVTLPSLTSDLRLAACPTHSDLAVFAFFGLNFMPLWLPIAAGLLASRLVRWRHRHLVGHGHDVPAMRCSALAVMLCSPVLLVSPTTFWLVVSYFEVSWTHAHYVDHGSASWLNTTDMARAGIAVGLALLYVSLVVMVAQRLAARWAQKTGAWRSICRGCGYELAGGECPECGPAGQVAAARWLWPAARVTGVGAVILALLASPMTLGIIDRIGP